MCTSDWILMSGVGKRKGQILPLFVSIREVEVSEYVCAMQYMLRAHSHCA
jgi:hypothetical protein